eukprot:TRINITY_DN13788_c0_g1_i3.p1 TRINITY_DN13788_c0_g1~~TRINITY_DN13788_c0_g1_i3.p1  ORF type:complete len:132 (+),score=4.74 TRINITY_DN13788_c0_g1_i3:1228-1623(+)
MLLLLFGGIDFMLILLTICKNFLMLLKNFFILFLIVHLFLFWRQLCFFIWLFYFSCIWFFRLNSLRYLIFNSLNFFYRLGNFKNVWFLYFPCLRDIDPFPKKYQQIFLQFYFLLEASSSFLNFLFIELPKL